MSVFLMLEAQEQAAAWKRRALAAEALSRSQSERVSRLEEALKAIESLTGGQLPDYARAVHDIARSALNQGADDGQ